MVPPYLVQLATESLYFSKSVSLYFFFSSLRLPFFIIYIGVASGVVGLLCSDDLRLVWLSFAASLLGLYLLLFVGCDPRVCYSTGIDGLEPLRSFSFFFAEGMAVSAVGFSARHRLPRNEAMLSKAAFFYAVAYYPVIYTVAGAKLVSPIAPFPVLAVVTLVSLLTSATVLDSGSKRWTAVVVPIATFLALLSVSIGIAAQYIPQIAPLMGAMLACVAVAGVVGALGPFGTMSAASRIAKSKALAVGIVAFVLLSIVVIPIDAVNATAPNLSTGSYYFLTPVVVGGFNPGPNIRPRGVAANFTFQGTNTSSIQPDNFLAAGIGAHSPNCCVDGIDYGYRGDVFVYHNATEVFAASAWEVCDDIIACGGHTWKHLMYFSSTRINSSIESNFQLSMSWQNHTAIWSYSSGNETMILASFGAPNQDNPYFNAGWVGPSSVPGPGGYPFFQFGVMSAFPIGHGGWSVSITCPSVWSNSTWVCLSHAELIEGDKSYWKFLWRWGEDYPDVGVTVNAQTKTMTFQYSHDQVQDFQTAW